MAGSLICAPLQNNAPARPRKRDPSRGLLFISSLITPCRFVVSRHVVLRNRNSRLRFSIAAFETADETFRRKFWRNTREESRQESTNRNLKNHRGDRSREKRREILPRRGNIFRNRSMVGVQSTGNIFLRLKSEKVFNRGGERDVRWKTTSHS